MSNHENNENEILYVCKGMKVVLNRNLDPNVGFDGCTDEPVEILHAFLLGIVKYMMRDFMNRLPASKRPELIAWYHSFDVEGLNIPSIQAEYLTKHYANFIGKDFRIVLQTAPFVLFEYMTDNEKMAWSSLCRLAPLVFETHIEDMAI